MIVSMDYQGRSGIANRGANATVAFATNTLREATFLRGTLAQPLLFREALAALYHVVVSDHKYRPKDRLEFRAWLEAQDWKFLANLGVKSLAARAKIELLEARRAELDKARNERLRPFHKARRAFFDFIYEKEYELQLLLDPVITVHPDEVSFEAFSRDESSYARLAVPYDQFAKVDAFECGTTNIDFSPRLHRELERIRSYRLTEFNIEPSGLSVAVGAAAVHKEKKIDLPESWVRGFLQVHSTMTLGLTHVEMEPVDLFNICRYLRRHKTRKSPRALRYELLPGERAKVVLEPWDHVVELGERSRFVGPKAHSVRTWGRNRLQILSRLLPVCKRVDVYLAGFGMPSIYLLDLGGMTFTLGLSGWTDNDWTGGANFELLGRRLTASAAELTQTYDALRQARFASDVKIATATGLGIEKCRSSLSFLCQAGRAMYDLRGQVYRHRELFLSPFSAQETVSLAKQTGPAGNPHQEAAQAIFACDNVRIIARRPVTSGYKLSGSAKGSDDQRVRPLLHVDYEGHIVEASCTCPFYKKSKLTQGPCEHILALRLAHMNRLEKEDQG